MTGRDVDTAAWRTLNRSWWDERALLHAASPFYDVEGFRDGRDSLQPFETALLGDVRGLRLLHLQCHFGLDSMSWARSHGASVVGLDFSAPAIDIATALAGELAIDAHFVCADVYDAFEALGAEKFDVVYTGFGALNWLPDLTRWARVIAVLLRPGGRLLLSEFHPFSWVFGSGPDRTGFEVVDDYFDQAPLHDDVSGTYADEAAATTHNATIEYQHPLSEVLGALLEAGLTLEAFEEHDYTLFPQFPWLEHDAGRYRVHEGAPRIPLIYALVARAPAPLI
ncbi:MAG: class I SAM-dependent methyltransferase [Acidimicrobiales bacterium]